LGFREIAPDGADFKGQPVRAGLAFRIDRCFIESRGPARSEDDVDRIEDREPGPAAATECFVEGDGADGALAVSRPIRQEGDDRMAVEDFDPLLLDLSRQAFEHHAGGEGAGRRRSLLRVVIGFVSDISAVSIAGKRHAEADEAKKRLGRAEGFAEGDVAVHGAAGEKIAGHLVGRVRPAARQRELIIGLLIRAGVVRCPAAEILGRDGDIGLSAVVETESGREGRRAAADDQRVQGIQGKLGPVQGERAFLHGSFEIKGILSPSGPSMQDGGPARQSLVTMKNGL